jgi:hypothetical protein
MLLAAHKTLRLKIPFPNNCRMHSNGCQISGAGNFEEITLIEHKPME